MGIRVNSRQRSSSAAFGAKRTCPRSGFDSLCIAGAVHYWRFCENLYCPLRRRLFEAKRVA